MPTGIVGSGCSDQETPVIADCLVGIDAGESACADAVTADGGGGNACYDCLYTAIPPTGSGPSLWGAYLQVGVEPAVGDAVDAFYINFGFDLGACILAASSAGKYCGEDIMWLDACAFAVCLPLCAVPNPGPGQPVDPAALAALNACFDATQSGACAGFATAAATDCAPLQDEGATGVYDQCQALVNQDDGLPGAGAPTEGSVAAVVGLICGGADAGF